MTTRRAALLLGVAALFAAAGWFAGRQIPTDSGRQDDGPRPETGSPAELTPAMRRLLLSMDEVQRRTALKALPPETAGLARQLFRQHPLPGGWDLFDLIDTNYDGFIDPREFEEAQSFIRIVPPPSAQRPASQPADLEMLLFLEVLEALDKTPPLSNDGGSAHP